MKIYRFKILVALLAFLLGIIGVWLVRRLSYPVFMSERETTSFETPAQVSEVSPEPAVLENKSTTTRKKIHPFKNYPVSGIYKGKNAPLKLTQEERELFGEKLQYTMKHYGKVEFAGRYIVATWSCGMWCDWSAVIDAKTGKVYWWDGMSSRCFPDLDTDFDCNEDFSNVDYRINSKLIIFFGIREHKGKKERGFHYYKFEKGRFIHLRSIRVKEQRTNDQIWLDDALNVPDGGRNEEK